MTSMEPVSIGEFKCRQRGRDFDELFRFQFVLAQSDEMLPPTWRRRDCAGWKLSIGRALAVTEILDIHNNTAGFLLGIAWNDAGEMVQRPVKLGAAADSDEFPRVFEEFSAQLGGRFIVLMLTARASRLYGDPASDLSWVYDQVRRTVGSTVSLLATYPLQPNPDFRVKSLLSGWTVTSFQHTIDQRIKRGISNHYLDLDTFTVHRFWPNADTIVLTGKAGIEQACHRIAEKLEQNLKAITSAYQCILPVTAGHDSRILLACSTDFLSDFSEFSGYRFHNPTRKDTRTGKDLVSRLGHKYRTYYKSSTHTGQISDFRLKNGWSSVRKELAALNMLEQYPRDAIILRGGILDMLRANQWRSDRIGKPPHFRYGLKRLRLRDGIREEVYNRWRPEYAAWFETLPGTAKSRVYDFAFIEHWLPHTLGAYYTGFHGNFFLNPFNDRELIGLAIGTSPKFRKSESVVKMVIQAASKELPVDVFN